MKTRPIKEILEKVLDEFKKGKTRGICNVIINLENTKVISRDEANLVDDFLRENKPDYNPLFNNHRLYNGGVFWWKRDTLGFEDHIQRVKFLQYLIEQCDNQNKSMTQANYFRWLIVSVILSVSLFLVATMDYQPHPTPEWLQWLSGLSLLNLILCFIYGIKS